MKTLHDFGSLEARGVRTRTHGPDSEGSIPA